MALLEFVLWMAPWTLIALAILYAGYAAFQASQVEARAPPPRMGPDPVEELARINTELARSATQARQSLESAREAFRKGLRG